jgi:4-amino-4-deoxy-L-arabinose transferase-like glycosyltransferase
MTASNETAAGPDAVAAIEGVIDTIAASRIRSAVAILIVALVAFLPGFKTIPPLDRDEPWLVLGSKYMVETGDYSDAGFVKGPRILQPIAIQWLHAASVAVFGDGAASPIWLYRLPSLLGAIAAAYATWWMALAFGRPRAALLAALLIATTPLLVAEAHLAKTDGIFLAATVLAQGALARLWLKRDDRPDYRLAFVFWSAVGLGILVKGLTAPFAIALTIGVLSASAGSFEWLRRLAPTAGAVWLAILVAPWLLAIAVAGSDVSPDAGLVAGIPDQQVYPAPPGTYAVLFYPLFGPAGVFVALAIPAVLDEIRRPVFLFAVAWVVPFWLAMELLPGKLPYYILPAFPALALVGATAIDEGKARVAGWVSTYFALNLSIWPMVVGSVAAILFFVAEERVPFASLPFFIAAIAVGAYGFRWFYRGTSMVGSAALSLLSTLLIYVGLFGVVFPSLTSLQISGRLLSAGKAAVTCDKPELVSTGYPEPSLVFYAGSGIRLVTPEEAADFLAAGGCRVAFVEERRQSIFNQRAADIGVEFDVRGEVRGGSIGNWRSVNMRVFAVEGQAF